ncbi:182 kDa tankyrase-1-binding protein isoform X1 [Anomalospiza imberbis]|uniref:182 kDa tankyrase-1-binding protein isoform X1 n=1 Tax=Anomalospiza imberbis TaxID=187417 RepID=UPI00358F00D4
MASQPQPLHPAVPCTPPAGSGGAGLAGSPDKGSARPKPPVRPKPRVLPKPAVPAKPPVPPPAPGPRHPRPELPSAEKMNRLAGPQPYSGAGAGGPVRRPSFTVRSPETPSGKGLSSPSVTGTEEEVPSAPSTPSRKGPAPFKVTPVPVAARPERFPGTTVEEILAKMDSREGPGSPDRAWLSPFCTDPSSRFGSKTFVAFRKRPSGEADGDLAGEAPQTPRPAAGELGMGDDGHPVAEMSSSPPAGPSCAGDPCGRRRPPSPPDLSTLQLGALGPPGSPRPPTCPARAPGAPFQPAELSAPAPGSPDAPAELLAPDSPTLPPGSPESPTRPPVEVPVTSIQAPGAPSATEPQLSVSRSPGSPHTPGERSPSTASPPDTPELPPRVTCPPGSPEAAAECLGPPSPPLAKASRPPGSPEGPDDSAVSPRSHEGPDFNPPPRDVGLRRSSEGVLRPPPTGRGLGELGGSLSALPRPGDLLSEPSLGSESGWSLSQSFEWTFPSRGARLPAFPPRSPIRETPDSGLSEEGESDGEAAAPGPPKDSRSEGPGSQQAEGAPCPGGPVTQREAEGSADEEEREAEQDAAMSHSPLRVTEPGQHPAEPESPTEPSLTTAAPVDPAAAADSAWAGDGPKSLQGPGGPGQAEGPSQDSDPHADPGWLTELLASSGVRGSPENLLGWSRKDLCSEFGIGRPRQDSTFDWRHPGASRERDWPVETKQDQEFGTKSSWDSNHSDKDSTARESWSGDYRAAELMGDTNLGCSDWSRSLGTGKSCPQDPDFSASTAEWGQGYGSTEELGSRQANWGSGLGTGHTQQLDKEPCSRQPTWADRYSSRDTEMKERELTPDWATKYSSQDAGSKDENLTLGWAGRSSTGDAGSPDKELRPSQPAWDRRYNPRDMESQDWEFSPSRPAWTREYRGTESQDREFSPRRSAWTGEYREMESQDQEFSSSKPAWDDRSSTRDMESQDREFSPSRPAWDDRSGTRDMESQDREFSPSRPAWDDRSSTRDMESQDREFSPSRPAWDDRSSTRDMESQDQEFSPSRPAWDDRSSTRDMESQDQEFSPSRPAWDDRSSTRDMESQDREFSPSRPAWDDRSGTRDMESQDREFSPSRPAWDDRSGTRDMESQDQEFSPSRPAWDDRSSTRDMESQDREFSPSRPAWDDRSGTRDMESQDQEFSPSRPAWDDRSSTRDMESQDREFSPSRPAWDDRSSTRDMESQDQEFSPSRLAEASECRTRDLETQDEFSPSRRAWDDRSSTRDMENQDSEFTSSRAAGDGGWSTGVTETRNGEFSPSRSVWDDRSSTRNVEEQNRELSPSGAAGDGQHSSVTPREEEQEVVPALLSWPGESSIGQVRVGEEDMPSSHRTEPLAQEPTWSSAHQQESHSSGSRDWELGAAECQNQFGVTGTERVPDPCSAGASDGSMSGVLAQPQAGLHRDFSLDMGNARWSQDLDSWSVEPQDAEARRQEWASAFSARCAAHSRDLGVGEQSVGGDTGAEHGLVPSPSMGDVPADCPAVEPLWSESPSHSEEERHPSEPAAAQQSPRVPPLLPEAASGIPADTGSEEQSSDHPDGESSSSLGEQRLSLTTPQPERFVEQGQEFPLLEDTELLDSSVFRCKASLGRKRQHRAPSLRPTTTEGESWIFRDSTEPQPALAASSDEEAAEEPRSRRMRGSSLGRGVKVPLFPSLSASAIKAKLRGRNRLAEEGTSSGDSKGTPPRDHHVQRSKSCKIPGVSGKPPALPPKPEKSSGSEASPPHWLQALKLKRKKP